MSKADEIIIDVFGNLQATTAGYYYTTLKEVIEYLEKNNLKHYIIFCQPIIENPIKKIATYYKIEYKATTMLPKDTLIVLADKEIIYPDFQKTIKLYRRRK